MRLPVKLLTGTACCCWCWVWWRSGPCPCPPTYGCAPPVGELSPEEEETPSPDVAAADAGVVTMRFMYCSRVKPDRGAVDAAAAAAAVVTSVGLPPSPSSASSGMSS